MDTKTESDKKLTIEILKQLATLSTSGFGVVAALAWNNVIQEIVDNYIKPYLSRDSGLASLALYAIGVTVLAVFITFYISKLIRKIEEHQGKRSQIK